MSIVPFIPRQTRGSKELKPKTTFHAVDVRRRKHIDGVENLLGVSRCHANSVLEFSILPAFSQAIPRVHDAFPPTKEKAVYGVFASILDINDSFSRF